MHSLIGSLWFDKRIWYLMLRLSIDAFLHYVAYVNGDFAVDTTRDGEERARRESGWKER